MKRKYILSILLGLLCVFGFGAEPSEYYYKNIGIEDGLSQSSVTSVVYDPYGSLWIGTRYGLNEYRNHEIRSVYKLGCIHTLFLDDSERLWWLLRTASIPMILNPANSFAEALLGLSAYIRVKTISISGEGAVCSCIMGRVLLL